MADVVGLSSGAVAGFYSLGAGLIAAASAIVVALITRDTRRQSKRVTHHVGEFERAWNQMKGERAADRKRMAVLERREDDCLESLTDAVNRIAVLEARLGVKSGE